MENRAIGEAKWILAAIGASWLLTVFVLPLVSIFFAVALLFTLYFFRDPERVPPPGESVAVSPADGLVTTVDEVEEDEIAAAEARWGAPPPPAAARPSPSPSPPSSPSSPSPAPPPTRNPNGIPIMPTRSPRPPAQVRDADGGFGGSEEKARRREEAAAEGAASSPAAAAARAAAAETPSPSSPPPPAVVSELSFGAPVPEKPATAPPAPVVEMADDGIDGSAW